MLKSFKIYWKLDSWYFALSFAILCYAKHRTHSTHKLWFLLISCFLSPKPGIGCKHQIQIEQTGRGACVCVMERERISIYLKNIYAFRRLIISCLECNALTAAHNSKSYWAVISILLMRVLIRNAIANGKETECLPGIGNHFRNLPSADKKKHTHQSESVTTTMTTTAPATTNDLKIQTLQLHFPCSLRCKWSRNGVMRER